MAEIRAATGLQTIFAIFLGLMVVAFAGVGVYTFYPSPKTDPTGQLRSLNREEQEIRVSKPPEGATPQNRARLNEISDERDQIEDAGRALREAWSIRTSIILIALATLAMAVSIVRPVALPVISNGVLLGGVFTMLYGTALIVVNETSTARFLVITLALLVTLVLGYVRFVRHHASSLGPDTADAAQSDKLAGLEERIRELEGRLNEAASVLGRKSDQSGVS